MSSAIVEQRHEVALLNAPGLYFAELSGQAKPLWSWMTFFHFRADINIRTQEVYPFPRNFIHLIRKHDKPSGYVQEPPEDGQ